MFLSSLKINLMLQIHAWEFSGKLTEFGMIYYQHIPKGLVQKLSGSVTWCRNLWLPPPHTLLDQSFSKGFQKENRTFLFYFWHFKDFFDCKLHQKSVIETCSHKMSHKSPGNERRYGSLNIQKITGKFLQKVIGLGLQIRQQPWHIIYSFIA